MAVIFLNGCTSAGKSSIVTALQARLTEPHLRLGIDDAFAMLPLKFHDHPDGFFFHQDEEGYLRLGFGPVGVATLQAHQRMAAVIASGGIGLILDEVIITDELRRGWNEALEGCDVFMVGIHCDLIELERRERARGDRMIGQARGQFAHVHTGIDYDLEIDTTEIAPATAADRIITAYLNQAYNSASR